MFLKIVFFVVWMLKVQMQLFCICEVCSNKMGDFSWTGYCTCCKLCFISFFSSWRLGISMLIIASLTDLIYISVIWKWKIILKAVLLSGINCWSISPLQVLYIYNAVHVKFGNKTHLSPLWLLSCLSKSFSFSVVGVII